MQPIDYAIILIYLAGLGVIGVLLARRAGQSAEHYFLGGRAMPWWDARGAANVERQAECPWGRQCGGNDL